MKEQSCKYHCIANVEGKCAVENCKGPITCSHMSQDPNLLEAARFYGYLSMMMCDTEGK